METPNQSRRWSHPALRFATTLECAWAPLTPCSATAVNADNLHYVILAEAGPYLSEGPRSVARCGDRGVGTDDSPVAACIIEFGHGRRIAVVDSDTSGGHGRCDALIDHCGWDKGLDVNALGHRLVHALTEPDVGNTSCGPALRRFSPRFSLTPMTAGLPRQAPIAADRPVGTAALRTVPPVWRTGPPWPARSSTRPGSRA